MGLGYEVLRDGAGNKEGKASIWTVGSDGVIDSSSGWFSGTDDFWSWEDESGVDLDNDGEIGNPNTEVNGALFVDGDGLYRLYDADTGKYHLLKNSNGVTYSDGSSGAWDAVSAIQQGDGTFRVLLDGAGSRENQASVWTTNAQGVITSKNGGWKAGEALQAYEIEFDLDLDGDGIPVNPEINIKFTALPSFATLEKYKKSSNRVCLANLTTRTYQCNFSGKGMLIQFIFTRKKVPLAQ